MNVVKGSKIIQKAFLLVSIFLLAFLVFKTTSSPPIVMADPNTDPLRWAPPELTNPTTINLGTGPTTSTLDNNTDYIINLPSTTKFGKTIISGGRNIHIIGGEIIIPENPGPTDSDKRAIQIANNQGIVHIEGVRIRNIHNVDSEADYQPYDGIVINSPNSVVQIQNVHIQDVHGTQAGFHGDIVQPWGGFSRLRVYNLTGSTGYQGMLLARDLAVNYGAAELENIDLTYNMDFGTDGGYLLYLDTKQQCTGSNGIYPISLNEIYIKPQLPRFGDSNETNAVGRSIMPDSQTSFGCPAQKQIHSVSGPDWYWPDLEQITDGVDSNGLVTTGLPNVTGNHFVPLGTPGLGIPGIGYTTPGYEDDEYTDPVTLPSVTNPLVLSDASDAIEPVQVAENQIPQSGGLATANIQATFDDPVTSGNAIVLAVSNYNNLGGPGEITGVTDNFGNTYVQAVGANATAAVSNGTRYHTSIWYAKNITGGSSFTVTAANANRDSYYAIAAVEYTGLDTLTPLGPTNTNFTSTSSTAGSAGSVTTTSTDNLIFASLMYPSGSTVTTVSSADDNFSIQKQYPGVPSLAAIDAFKADIGTYTGSLVWSGAQPTLGVIAAFEPPPPTPVSFTPTLNVTSPTNDTTPIVSFSTTDPLGIDRYEVKVDGGAFSEQTSPYTLPALSEDEHLITVRAYNTGETYRDGFVSVTVDLTDPEIEITAPTTTSNNEITDATVTVTDDIGVQVGDVSSSIGSLSCSQTSSTQVDCTVNINQSGNFFVTAQDQAGNSTQSSTVAFRVVLPPSGSVGAPTCTAVSPTSAPVIYSGIAQGTNSIRLDFTQALDPVTNYVLEFGTESGIYKYSSPNIGGKEIKSYVVSSLDAGKIYYFRLRASNDCATGPWSREFIARTNSIGRLGQLEITQSTLTPTPIPDLQEPIVEVPQDETNLYDVQISVTDTTGQPVLGAQVTLHSTPRISYTDTSGQVFFSNVEEGPHRVLVAYDGQEGEQAINLTGDVEEFKLNITIEKQNVWQTPQLLGTAAVLGTIIIILIVVILRLRKR